MGFELEAITPPHTCPSTPYLLSLIEFTYGGVESLGHIGVTGLGWG